MGSPKLYDRQVNFSGGMNAYLNPYELPPNQSQLLQNMVVMDNGRAITRPGADALGAVPGTGAVNGLFFLNNYTNGTRLLAGKGTSLYAWDNSSWSSLSISSWNPAGSFVGVQGNNYLMISDGSIAHGMQIWDGATFHQFSNSSSPTNAPLGVTILSYIAGMFVAAGTSMHDTTGTVYPADTLFFSNYLLAGYSTSTGAGGWNNLNSIRVGVGDGDPIVALAPIQSTAGATPSYNLAVLKQNSVWILTWNPATSIGSTPNWTAAPQGEQTGINTGCVGSQAWCQYQNDVLFMSQDGVQSIQRMQAASGQYQLTSPLSLPIQPYIDRIHWAYASGIQAVKYHQYAIFFVPLDNATVNNYALVWDGRIGQWMIWTGWTPTAACVTRFNGIVQLVIGDSTGGINLWKDSKAVEGVDSTYLDNGAGINWSISTRSMIFGNLDFQKKPHSTQVKFNRGNSNVSLAAYLDLSAQDNWVNAITPSGIKFPIQLPFILTASGPTSVYRTLEGIPYFNEMYLTIAGTAPNYGWADVRNVVVSAFSKPIRNPDA